MNEFKTEIKKYRIGNYIIITKKKFLESGSPEELISNLSIDDLIDREVIDEEWNNQELILWYR